MWLFICGAMLGGVIGIGIMCLLQINRYEAIKEDSKEEK